MTSTSRGLKIRSSCNGRSPSLLNVSNSHEMYLFRAHGMHSGLHRCRFEFHYQWQASSRPGMSIGPNMSTKKLMFARHRPYLPSYHFPPHQSSRSSEDALYSSAIPLRTIASPPLLPTITSWPCDQRQKKRSSKHVKLSTAISSPSTFPRVSHSTSNTKHSRRP